MSLTRNRFGPYLVSSGTSKTQNIKMRHTQQICHCVKKNEAVGKTTTFNSLYNFGNRMQKRLLEGNVC